MLHVCLASLKLLPRVTLKPGATSRLATTDMGRKLGRLCPFWGRGPGFPSNTWPGPSPTTIPSFIWIHPTVWPKDNTIHQRHRQTGQTDRQTDNGPIAYGEPFYKQSPKKHFVTLHKWLRKAIMQGHAIRLRLISWIIHCRWRHSTVILWSACVCVLRERKMEILANRKLCFYRSLRLHIL